jgi:uncharacterized protein with FMN-binding domain
MKKITLLVALASIALFSLLSLQGCMTNQGSYRDGVYDEKIKSPNPGYEEAVVTIKGGKIDSIDLKRLDDNQVEVNYDDWDGTKNGFPNLKKYRIDLANAMIAKQSSDVDSISGATLSSNGWKAAVDAALAKAKQ